MPGKAKSEAALVRAGLSRAELADRAGLRRYMVDNAFNRSIGPEGAGKIAAALGNILSLTAKEKKEIFAELIHAPSENQTPETLMKKVSSEDPNFFLWEGAGSEEVGHYSFDGHKASGLRPRKDEGESSAEEDRQDVRRDAGEAPRSSEER